MPRILFRLIDLPGVVCLTVKEWLKGLTQDLAQNILKLIPVPTFLFLKDLKTLTNISLSSTT